MLKLRPRHGPGPIDADLGARVRARRHVLGLSQPALAAALGVSAQQIQKYERGHSRISAATLLALSQALKTDIGYYFEPGLSALAPAASGAAGLDPREAARLVTAYARAPASVRPKILALVESLALAAPPED